MVNGEGGKGTEGRGTAIAKSCVCNIVSNFVITINCVKC